MGAGTSSSIDSVACHQFTWLLVRCRALTRLTNDSTASRLQLSLDLALRIVRIVAGQQIVVLHLPVGRHRLGRVVGSGLLSLRSGLLRAARKNTVLVVALRVLDRLFICQRLLGVDIGE